jgi:hypothetical protein
MKRHVVFAVLSLFGFSLMFAALLCGLGCSPINAVAERQPDEMLFERAIAAAEHKHFSVARLTLQTLVNTYPDSEYADKAKSAFRDPRIATCGDGTPSPDCEIAKHSFSNW